jgi:hypothetical protein
MSVHSYLPALAAGRPDLAEEWIRRGWEAWPQKGNVMGAFWGLYGRVEAALYRGDGPGAPALLDREQGELGSYTLYQLMQILKLVMAHLEARAALAAAEAARPNGGFFGGRSGLLRAAARQARGIEKARMPWSDPLAALLRAGAANLRGRPDDAAWLLTGAEAGLEQAGMRMYAAARRQRGRLLGGDEGQGLMQQADAFMTGEGVREPDRIAAVLVPGFPD